MIPLAFLIPPCNHPPEENLSYDERIEKGDYYFKRGFYSFAATEYRKAAYLKPNTVDSYLKLLDAYFHLGDYQKSKQTAEVILKFDPNHFETKFTLFRTLLKQSDFEGAKTLFTELKRMNPTHHTLMYYDGLLSVLDGKYDEGKKKFQSLKNLQNVDSKLIEKTDRFLNAYTEFEFAQAAEPLYRSMLLARAMSENQEYELAIHLLKDMIRERSDLRDAWILLGFSYMNLDKYLFALTSFERAYELDSQWPSTQYFLGLTHAELGNTDQAIIFLNYALNNGFEPSVAVEQKLAELYIDSKRYADAAQAYRKVLEENNSDITTFIQPVWIYLDFLSQPKEALKIAQQAVIKFPEDPMAYNLLGWAQIGTGNFVEAEKNLNKALEMDSNLAAAHLNFGKLYEAQDHKEKAMAAYQKAYELDQNGSVGNQAAQSYNQLQSE